MLTEHISLTWTAMTPRSRPPTLLQRVMQLDVTVPLAVGALVFCGVAAAYGLGAAVRVSFYTFGVLFLLGMPLLLLHFRAEELERFREVRDEFGGRLRRGWFPLPIAPSLSFEYRNSPARLRVEYGSPNSHRPGMVSLQVEWPDASLELGVRREDVVSGVARMAGWTDIEVGRSVFDDTYCVSGSDADLVRRRLSRDVQRTIAGLPEQSRLSLSIRRGLFIVRAEYRPDRTDLVKFTASALNVYDGLREACE